MTETGAGGSFESDAGDISKQQLQEQPQENALQMTNIQVEELGQKIAVSWQISGDPSNVRAYQVFI